MTKLETTLQDSRLPGRLARYLGIRRKFLAEKYSGFASHLESRRFVVPFTGVQGCGKSSLLNALLFNDTVLPMDADETTCIPVEIVYCERPSGKALVRFISGRERRVPATEASLAGFVHNQKNPGNEKNVDRVILESSSRLLETGMVLVDLPGAGSLTRSNVETMQSYLEEAVGIVFLFRTVPTITRSESIFVAFQWARLPTAFFVQNRWTDETDEEAKAGIQHNLLILKKLAGRNRIRLASDPVIHPVTAYQALKGRLTGEEKLAEASGLIRFEEELFRRARGWPEELRANIIGAVRGDLLTARENLEKMKADLGRSREELKKQIAAEDVRFRKYLSGVDDHLKSLLDGLEKFLDKQEAELKSWRKKAESVMRNEMRKKLRQGIVDGQHLTKALLDEQSLQADEIFEVLQENIFRFQDELSANIAEISVWKSGKAGFRAEVRRSSKTKYEGVLPTLASAAGGIGGLVGGAALGAKYGAVIGISGGPIGSVIGGVVGGLVGGLVGLFIGKKSKDAVVMSRAKKAEPEVFRAIDKFIEATIGEFRGQLDRFKRHLEGGLNAWREEQKLRFETERKNTLEALQSSGRQKTLILKRLKSDDVLIGEWMAGLEEGRK